VGFVWQQASRNLVPYLTAVENVELPMVLAGIETDPKRTWAHELLESVGLSGRSHHRMAQLSGGEQQRVAIAVALANRPKLLLADEPTGEVDTATAGVILETFGRLNRQYDLTTIIVTHDHQTARFVDRVVQIRDGKTSAERVRKIESRSAENTPASVEFHEYVVLDSAGRLQLPQEYRERLDIGDRVEVDLLEDGVLIRPVEGRGLTSPGERAETERSGDTPRRPRRGWWFRRWRRR
jgi:ABC-type nitrate/sulfonate/bicarbonate transport system ATPase subunit